MKKLFYSALVIGAMLATTACDNTEAKKVDTTMCAEHAKNCPKSENCPEHPQCEAHEACADPANCKEHPSCVAFAAQSK